MATGKQAKKGALRQTMRDATLEKLRLHERNSLAMLATANMRLEVVRDEIKRREKASEQ